MSAFERVTTAHEIHYVISRNQTRINQVIGGDWKLSLRFQNQARLAYNIRLDRFIFDTPSYKYKQTYILTLEDVRMLC